MNDDVQYGLVVAFPDESASFVHGFEAGQIWQLMSIGSMEIGQTVHVENLEVINRMARSAGYELTDQHETGPADANVAIDGWLKIVLKKLPPKPHLRVVQ